MLRKQFSFRPSIILLLLCLFLPGIACKDTAKEPVSGYAGNQDALLNKEVNEEEYSPATEAEQEHFKSGSYTVTMKDANGLATTSFETSGTASNSFSSTQNSVASTGDVAVKKAEKIIKTANINFSVDDYKKARLQVEKIVKAQNAYIATENEQNNNYSISNDMTIRVMSKDFDELVNKLVAIAKEVNNKTITTQDVTAQFVDIQARLKTKREVEQRYIALLQKAHTIQDILDIESNLRMIREEIEAKEGQLKCLSDQVSYSTIQLHFYHTHEFEPSDKPGFFNRLGSAFGAGWKGFLNFLIGLVYAWPVWLIMGTIGYFVYKYVRRTVRKRK